MIKQEKLNGLEIDVLAKKTCRLHYDQTSVVFDNLSYLLVRDAINTDNSDLSKSGGIDNLSVKVENNANKFNYFVAASLLLAAKSKIDDAWKNCKDHMNSCETKHYRTIKGYNSMKEIAVTANDSQENLYSFIKSASFELKRQSKRDSELNHPKLSSCLNQAALYLDDALIELSKNY
ncbi:MAG: hypothetical protein WC758_02690 [Candidatus Woesearchaeota archaeon]|jgi:hypothetical protein